jgi:hypothetical protein
MATGLDAIFQHPLAALYNAGGVDQFRLCNWGILKRAVDGELCGQRPAKEAGGGWGKAVALLTCG